MLIRHSHVEKKIMEIHSLLNSIFACSAIYVIDGYSGQTKNIIWLGHGELIRDIDINPHLGKIYAAGEYSYLENDSYANEDELIRYEDDVAYIIDNAASCLSASLRIGPQAIPGFLLSISIHFTAIV
ncbi:MAG: hypothetical protein WBX01_09225 [Nitrososphaeraceae archaeon]